MGMTARLRDAEVLYVNGQYEGALLAVLIAIAATARKRYPKARHRDRLAFCKFFKEEFCRRVPCRSLSIYCNGKQEFIEDIFYEYMRCSLVHEGTLPPQIRFEPGDEISFGGGDQFMFTHGWLKLLASMVEQAPENAAEFAV